MNYTHVTINNAVRSIATITTALTRNVKITVESIVGKPVSWIFILRYTLLFHVQSSNYRDRALPLPYAWGSSGLPCVQLIPSLMMFLCSITLRWWTLWTAAYSQLSVRSSTLLGLSCGTPSTKKSPCKDVTFTGKNREVKPSQKMYRQVNLANNST